MWNKIKSAFITKNIFSFPEENKKLKLVKYNKILQNRLDITITNFKVFSGKYIIYESNQKIKEYDFENNLLYEGEYLDGKRNGEGKEYKDDILVFEGEYHKGKRHGNGKEFLDDNLIFEGVYLNGKKNGKGIEYYYNGYRMFEGIYLNDKRLVGTLYDKEGNKKDEINNTHENGKEYDNDGNLIFKGNYSNCERNGKGKEYKNNILIFEGEYLNGLKNGKGKKYKNNTLIFEGTYLNDRKWEGKGYDLSNNLVYELVKGKGLIKEYHSNGRLKFEGEYLNGLRNGKGKEYDSYGYLIYEGEYLNDKKNGKGEYHHFIKYEGEFLNDKKHGEGKEYNIKNDLLFEDYLKGNIIMIID